MCKLLSSNCSCNFTQLCSQVVFYIVTWHCMLSMPYKVGKVMLLKEPFVLKTIAETDFLYYPDILVLPKTKSVSNIKINDM